MRRTISVAGAALAALTATVALAQPIPSVAPIQLGAPPPSAPAPGPIEPQGLAEGVIAVVNDGIITSFDLRQRMALLIATSGVRPTRESLPQIQQQALRMLIDERLQIQELARLEVNIPDAQVNAEIGALAEQNNTSAEALFANLTAMGVRPETLRNQMRAQIGWRILVSERFRTRARAGEDQIDETLKRVTAAAAKPQYLIGEVYIDASQVGGMNEAMVGANALVRQIAEGAPFQAVARQFSSATSAANGGDAGWVLEGDMHPEVFAVLEQMQPGQLSNPIQTRDGVYIVYLREKRTGELSTMVNLKQAAVRVAADASEAEVQAATAKLNAIRSGLDCDNIATKAEAAGALSSDLGENDIAALAPEFRAAVEPLAAGQISAPVRTAVGVHVLALCGKRLAGADVPTREQVGNRLFGQQLTMLARRYMRDLRNSATIEIR